MDRFDSFLVDVAEVLTEVCSVGIRLATLNFRLTLFLNQQIIVN